MGRTRTHTSRVCRERRWLIAALVVVTAFIAAPSLASAGTSTPTVSTDQLAYSPGGVASLSGAGFVAGDMVSVTLADSLSGDTYASSAALVSSDGTFSGVSLALPSMFTSSLTATATDAATGDTASIPVTETPALPAFTPTITTDQQDYSPGSVVTITGSGWPGGDSLSVFTDDADNHSWSQTDQVTTDASGDFTDKFTLPLMFVANYSVTATDTSGLTATTTFTDGNVTLHLPATEGVANMTVNFTKFSGSTTCSGTGVAGSVGPITSGGSANIPGFGGSGDSVRLTSVTTTTGGKAFDRWTSGTGQPPTDSGNLVPGSPTPCISNSASGTNGNLADAYAHFKNTNVAPVANGQSVSTNEDTPEAITLSATDADGNSLTFSIVTAPAHGSLGSIGAVSCSGTPSTCTASVTYSPNANYNGSDSFTFKVNDGTVDSSAATVSITVLSVNDAPTALASSVTTNEDTDKTFAGADFNFSDANDSPANGLAAAIVTSLPGNGSLLYNGTALVAGDLPKTVTAADLSAGKLVFRPAANDNGSPYTSFNFKIQDDGGTANGGNDTSTAAAAMTINVLSVNDAPVVTAGANQSGNENDTITASSTFTDVEPGDSHTCSIDWGDGSVATAGTVVEPSGATPGTCTGSHKYLDDNPTGTPSDDYTATFTVTDNGTTNGSPDPKSGSATLKVTIANLAPVVTSVTGPSVPLALGGSGVNATVVTNFTDVGSKDTHTCTYTWDDLSAATTVSAPGTGNGSCSATHTYTAAGVYQVGVTVKDDDTGTATGVFQYVVVYDANAGFVTGGGWIMSPAGAYAANPTLTGRANFGFTSQYKKGATVPTGETEFQFQVASFDFHSSDYQWLVVSGPLAQYKGTGTVNGVSGYSFLLTATDGAVNGGGGVDKFRIKVWNTATSAVVYDNSLGSSDDINSANPEAISGGSIVIHK